MIENVEVSVPYVAIVYRPLSVLSAAIVWQPFLFLFPLFLQRSYVCALISSCGLATAIGIITVYITLE